MGAAGWRDSRVAVSAALEVDVDLVVGTAVAAEVGEGVSSEIVMIPHRSRVGHKSFKAPVCPRGSRRFVIKSRCPRLP